MKRILYITATLPALTVTFIYKEIFRLRALGFEIHTVSMNTPNPREVGTESRSLRETTHYLDRVLLLAKLWFFAAMSVRYPGRLVRCLREYCSASPMQGVRDYARLAYHLLEGGYLAHRYRHSGIEHIHAHFINGPTSIAMFMGLMLDVPFSFTMHASMIWLDPIAVRNKLGRCKFLVSISEYNRQYVSSEYGRGYATKIHVVHCGIDAERTPQMRDSGQPATIRLLSIGQLNPRKGFQVLIPACKMLTDRRVSYQCTIIGEGAQRPELEGLIRGHRLEHQVTLLGAVPHEQIPGFLSRCDLFVLPCVISKDGYRDGIPVALMEAMFDRLPVVSTDILGLPELIENGVSGVLVPPDDFVRLADAIAKLAADVDLRRRLGDNAHARVVDQFNNERSARALAALFNGQ